MRAAEKLFEEGEKSGEASRGKKKKGRRKKGVVVGWNGLFQANIKTNMFMIGRLRLHHRVSPDIWGPRKGFVRERVCSHPVV